MIDLASLLVATEDADGFEGRIGSIRCGALVRIHCGVVAAANGFEQGSVVQRPDAGGGTSH
ncbi:MAG: hypothetical protein ACR2GY_01520 [Phycisphaerales bacterium]